MDTETRTYGAERDPEPVQVKKGVSCSTCIYYVSHNDGSDLGGCRRHAPHVTGMPTVMESFWCGDHTYNRKEG